jgi:YVTN family beta-propeller protein
VFHAGNRTSIVTFGEAFDSLPPPNPPMAGGLPAAPHVALIIQRQGANWVDETGKLWNSKTPYSVLDTDVAEIDAATGAITRTFGAIGTVNFGLAVSPADGRLAITATEARNLVRFEPNLAGHNVDTRIGFVSTAGAVTVRNLNPDVNYAVTPGPASERDSALGIPAAVAFAPDGQRAYVTSLASDRLGVIDPNGGADAVLARVPTVAGPSGVVVDAARGRVYVVGRFRNQLQTLSAATLAPLAVAAIGFDPTPDPIVNGRKFFYGGSTSGHGEHACASCHVFGDFDNIAWDLGDPQGVYAAPPPPQNQNPTLEGFHPMKGPMVTQSLRGLPGTGVLHWRGDRINLAAFNPAFVGLLGRSAPLPDSEMTAFSDFVMPLVYPPNPNRLLDRTPPDAPPGTPSALRGETFFFGTPVDGGQTCNFCHAATDFGSGTNGIIFPDDVLLDDQDIKVPQLRNLYKKTGFSDQPGAVNTRGFGFTHDGGIDNLFRFLQLPVFNFGIPAVANGHRRDVEAFLHAFDTGVAPAVGFQITFHGANNADPFLATQLDTLKQQRQVNYCDLVAKGRIDGMPRGWEYIGGDQWRADVAGEANLSTAALIALAAAGTEVTITGVPNGAGTRMGVDRDRDGHRDGDERLAGSDPGNPLSTPGNVAVGPGADMRFAFRAITPNPARDGVELRFTLASRSRVTAIAYDVMGRESRRIADGVWLEAGPQALRWDGRHADGTVAPAGVYFVRVATDRGERATRMLVRVP